MKLSACVLVRNEEENLKRLLPTLDFCDEIVAIDDYSTDNTEKVLKVYKAKIYKRRLAGDFSSQRNFGISKTKGDWILFVDADELITKDLKKEILSAIKNKSVKAFRFKRFDYFWGKLIKYGEISNFNSVRLAKRDAGKWKRKVHEYWDINGQVSSVGSPLLHYPHQSINEFILDVTKYSKIHALENRVEGKRSSLLSIIFKPIGKFIVSFFLQKGYKDGIRGFIISSVMSYHSFLAWSRLWIIQKKK